MTKEQKKILDQFTADNLSRLPDGNQDREQSHKSADDTLCELLNKLGFPKTVAEFKKLEKWYS